jgi:hypothetical protein
MAQYNVKNHGHITIEFYIVTDGRCPDKFSSITPGGKFGSLGYVVSDLQRVNGFHSNN